MSDQTVARLERRLARARARAEQAEQIAEDATRALYGALAEHERDHARFAEEMRARDGILSSAAHELRTPLTVISGMLHTLATQATTLSEDQRKELARRAQQHAERLTRLIDALLSMARTQVLHLDDSVSTDALVVARGVAETLGVDRVSVTGNSGDNGVHAAIAPEALEAILSNFVSNAQRYGAPPVEVLVISSGSDVLVEVSDEGEGVPVEFVPRLFDRHSRAVRAGDGVGLGLAIAATLARAHAGAVGYRPSGSGGSCFWVRVPAAAATADEPATVATGS